VLVYLQADDTLIEARLSGRHGHFMPATLLASQYDDLEEPAPEEKPIVVPAALAPARQLALVLAALTTAPGTA
jgi:gluconokinase